jgi:hypothetical protein
MSDSPEIPRRRRRRASSEPSDRSATPDQPIALPESMVKGTARSTVGKQQRPIFSRNQIWQIQRLGRAYFLQLDSLLTGTGNYFSGHYFQLDNPSIFEGEIVTENDVAIVRFIQKTPGNEYYAVHVGQLITYQQIEGDWYDTANNVGEFILKLC